MYVWCGVVPNSWCTGEDNSPFHLLVRGGAGSRVTGLVCVWGGVGMSSGV